MAFCTSCSKPLRPGATFCTACGATVRAAGLPASQPTAGPPGTSQPRRLAIPVGSASRALQIGGAGLLLVLIALFFGYRPRIPFPSLSLPGRGAPATKEAPVDTSSIGPRFDAFAQMKERAAQENAELDRRVEDALARKGGYADAPR